MSNMVMVPELDLGIFLSSNSGGGRDLVTALPVLLLERYLGPSEEAPLPPEDFAERGQGYAGSYLVTRRSYSMIEKLASVASVVSVSVDDDGYLVTSLFGDTARWVEVGANLFREAGGDRFIAFAGDGSGAATHIFFSSGVTAGERISFFGGMGWLILVTVLAWVTAFGLTIGAWLRRRVELRQTAAERNAAQVMAGLGVSWSLFFIGFTAAMVEIAALGNDVVYDFPTTRLVVALVLLIPAAILTAVSLIWLPAIWRHASWPVWRRLRHSCALLVLLAFVATLAHWNVLGFRYF